MKEEDNANTQARAGNGGTVPPKARQFGQPNGNPRGRGFWKREDTPRYKLEQMMKMSESELEDVVIDKDASLFERRIAVAISKSDWKTIESAINQVYGLPKQEIEQRNIEIKPILPKKEKK